MGPHFNGCSQIRPIRGDSSLEDTDRRTAEECAMRKGMEGIRLEVTFSRCSSVDGMMYGGMVWYHFIAKSDAMINDYSHEIRNINIFFFQTHPHGPFSPVSFIQIAKVNLSPPHSASHLDVASSLRLVILFVRKHASGAGDETLHRIKRNVDNVSLCVSHGGVISNNCQSQYVLHKL